MIEVREVNLLYSRLGIDNSNKNNIIRNTINIGNINNRTKTGLVTSSSNKVSQTPTTKLELR